MACGDAVYQSMENRCFVYQDGRMNADAAMRRLTEVIWRKLLELAAERSYRA